MLVTSVNYNVLVTSILITTIVFSICIAEFCIYFVLPLHVPRVLGFMYVALYIAVHILIVNILLEYVYQIHIFQLSLGIIKCHQTSHLSLHILAGQIH